MYHFHRHLYFLKGSTVWISPLAVLWGITKVNCSFTGTGEVTPATLLPPSLFPPSFLVPLQFLQTSPSLALHHSTAQMHPATDGLTWDSYVTSPSLSQYVQGQSRHSASSPRKTNNTTSVLQRHTGNMSIHIVMVVDVCTFHWWHWTVCKMAWTEEMRVDFWRGVGLP